MPYRLKPGVPLVCVRNRKGEVVYHYANPPHGMSGPIIPWLSDDQAAHLLRIQYIERIHKRTGTDVTLQPDGQDRIHALIVTLDELGLPVEAGSPRTHEVLRDAGHQAPNELIAAAVKLRKRSHG